NLADPEPAILCTEALCRVRKYPQPVLAGDLLERPIVGGLAKKIDRNDANRPQARASRRVDPCNKAFRIDIERILQRVDKYRSCVKERNHFGGGRKGEGRTEYSIARFDALGHQAKQQRIGAVPAAEGVSRAAEFGELALELDDLATHDEVRALAHAQER